MKVKSLLLLLVSSFMYSFLFSQGYRYVYYFDKDLNSTSKSKSIVTGKGLKDEGLFQLDYYLNETGKLFMSVHFTDSTLSVMQGVYRSYYPTALLEEAGEYENNGKEGLWTQWNKDGLKTDSVIYEKNNRMRFAKFEYYNKQNAISSFAYTDSLANTFIKQYYRDNGTLSSEASFIGQNGLWRSYDSTGVNTRRDSVFTREETEAKFSGGDPGWRTFLVTNLNTEVPSNNRAPSGSYTVIIKFIVETDGTLSNILAETGVGYGAEAEAIRVIKKSPIWLPAKQYGRLVRAYRRQPITFSVDGGR